MAGLVPAIHVFFASTLQIVDARHKAGHDREMCVPNSWGEPRRSISQAMTS